MERASSCSNDGRDGTVDDHALAERAGNDDRGAADELVYRYYPKVYRLVHRMSGGDADAAEERTQDIFLKIFERIEGFRQEAAFSTWIYRIAVNACLDDRRRRRRWMKLLTPWPFGRRRAADSENAEEPPDTRPLADPEEVLRGRQLDGAVRAAMAALTDKQRMVFHLKVFEGFRISEIAAIMEMAEGTVKSHLFRATHALRERLNDWIDKE